MRLAFLGTPDFALPTLAALMEAGHEIACVYSQPPAPRGRGQTLRRSPVHSFAAQRGLSVRTPADLRAPEEVAAFSALQLDAAVIVAFGQILNAPVLDAPRLGCFNLHGSMLPRWRGAAPIQRAIMAGDAVTAVQVMRMTEGLDEGAILASTSLRIDAWETAGTLHDRMAPAGAALMVSALAAVARGGALEIPQAQEGATYARKIRPAHTQIDWSKSAEVIDRKIRGLAPSPGAWFIAPSDKGPVRIKALLSQLADATGEPGRVLAGTLVVGCGTRAVQILRAQRQGREAQDAEEFLRGFALGPGTQLS